MINFINIYHLNLLADLKKERIIIRSSQIKILEIKRGQNHTGGGIGMQPCSVQNLYF